METVAVNLTEHQKALLGSVPVIEQSRLDILEKRLDALSEEVSILHGRLVVAFPVPAAPDPLTEFSRPKTDQWPFGWHGRPDQRPNALPMTKGLTKVEAITRARWGYDPLGRLVKSGADYDKAWKTVEAIRATAYSLPAQWVPESVGFATAAVRAVVERFNALDLEFACFGTLIGLWPATPEEEMDGGPKPSDFKGQTIESYIQQFEAIRSADEP